MSKVVKAEELKLALDEYVQTKTAYILARDRYRRLYARSSAKTVKEALTNMFDKEE